MANVSVTLVSGQTASVGIVSSREAYELEVSSGVAGATGVGVVDASIVGGMLNITLSNTAVINAGSVSSVAHTGSITFTDNTIAQFSNGTVNIQAGANVYAFGNTGVVFPDGTTQTTAFTGSIDTVNNAIHANNASYLGGVAANQYAYANQVGGTVDRLVHGGYSVVLGTDGVLTTSGNSTIATSNTGSNTNVKIAVHWNDPSASPAVNHVTSTYTFSGGGITFPDDTVQSTAYTGPTSTDQLTNGSYTAALESDGRVTIPGTITTNGAQNIEVNPSNDGYAYIRVPKWDDGGERMVFINQYPNSAGFYFHTEGNHTFRMYQNQLGFPDSTWQTTAFTGDANNALYLGGVDASQYAYANQVTSTTSYDQLTLGFPRIPSSTATNAIHAIDISTTNTDRNGATIYDTGDSRVRTYIANTGWFNYASTADLSSYQTTTGLAANVAALTSNNTLYLGGTAANQFTTYAGSYTWSGNQTFTGNVAVININSEQHAQIGYNITNVPMYSGAGANAYVWMSADLSNTNTQAVISHGDITGWTITAEDNPAITATVISMSPVGYWGVGTSAALPYSAGRTFKFTSPNYAAAYTGPVNVVANGYTWAFNANGSLKFADNSLQTTAFTGNANNALYLGGTAAASYLVTNTAINTGNVSVTGNITLTGNLTGNTAGFEIGYKDVPQNYTNTSFTIALSDRGKHIYTSNGTSQTITIANNATVAFPIGTAISIVSQGAGTITVARGAGVSMYLAANNTSADRTISTYGMATLLKVATDTWFISGAGVV